MTYRDQAISTTEASVYFVDATDGRLRLKYNLLEHQSAVVQGTGVLGDTKKVSVRSLAGTFMADDQLRPPALQTYDMQGNLAAALNALNWVTTLSTANLAQNPSATAVRLQKRNCLRPRLMRPTQRSLASSCDTLPFT